MLLFIRNIKRKTCRKQNLLNFSSFDRSLSLFAFSSCLRRVAVHCAGKREKEKEGETLYVFVFLKETSKLCVCVSLLSWPIYFAKGRWLRLFPRSFIWFWILVEINSRNRIEAATAPAPARKAPAASTGVTGTKKLDDGATNPWDLAQIWVESVAKEEATRKQWEQTHAWMADFDPRVWRSLSCDWNESATDSREISNRRNRR